MPGRTTLDVFVVGVSLAVPTIYDGKAQQLRSMKNSDGLTKADLLIPDGIREEGFAHFSRPLDQEAIWKYLASGTGAKLPLTQLRV